MPNCAILASTVTFIFLPLTRTWKPNLQPLGEVFDNEIYSQLLSLWDVDTVPSYEGDERVVILMLQGYDRGRGRMVAIYTDRQSMPGDLRSRCPPRRLYGNHHDEWQFTEIRRIKQSWPTNSSI